MRPSWLEALAAADKCKLHEAAAILVENGVVMSAEDWCSLSTKERATITAARRLSSKRSRADALAAAGRDLDAARELAEIDDGIAASRLMAHATVQALAAGLRRAAP